MAKEMDAVKHQIEEQNHTKTAYALWLMFKNAVADAAAKYIPSKTCKSREQLPYMTRELVKLIRKRDRIYKKRQRAKWNFECSTAGYRNTDKKLRDIKKEIQKKLRQAYWNYIESIITPMDDDTEQRSGMKRFWQFVKSRRKDHTGIAKVNGKTISSPKDKDTLNTQFESVFNKVGDVPDDLMPDSPHPCTTDIEITTPGVQKMMERLKVHKAAGPDGIGPMILKTLAPSIAPILIIIYQRSYNTGLIPEDWRNANVAPVYKKGKSSAPSNYRPLSLTCIACKLMEYIVTSHIMRHASRHNLLYKLQHGFRDKRSCETQLIEFQADVLQNMKDGSQTDILIMDFSKAFDKVSHKHLMEKLKFYGIRGKCNTWISDFLTDRTQAVVVDGERSYEARVTSGVPQGSVLGPSLFLLYINDIAEELDSTVRLFADDTIVYLAVKNSDDADSLQNDLHKLGRWEKKWLMEFHPDKCQVLTITRKRQPVTYNYILNGHQLEHVSDAKYLGITFTNDMRWNQHIDNITAKANKTLHFLQRNVHISCPRLKTTAYQTFVRRTLEYATMVWDPHTKGNIHKIEMVQRRAARYVLHRYHNRSSVSEMLQHLNWPLLEVRRQHQRLAMLYKIHHSMVAVNKAQYLTPAARTSRHTHRSSYLVNEASTDYIRQSLFPRTVRVEQPPSHCSGRPVTGILQGPTSQRERQVIHKVDQVFKLHSALVHMHQFFIPLTA